MVLSFVCFLVLLLVEGFPFFILVLEKVLAAINFVPRMFFQILLQRADLEKAF
ncbi:hypothetical protein LMANV2_530008 [Leptospira interrogans serovar Manilae]|uniref:Uncharacterized protein n=1 Tax=Leptospira interrogans serovar Manilae TaxID=214675 RepID=A0AAQ1P2Q3_LEPIR|nr:hypothetical protein LMANV2_530008 [Leptospira interrogans serovar Manilae]